MTIYEALGIEDYLVDTVIPKEVLLENMQSSALSKNAKTYFKVIDRVVLRTSIPRSVYELHVIEISLNEPKFIQEISKIIQTAIKYQILFVFSYKERFLIARRSFELTDSTDHVYSENISFTTEWIYSENLSEEIFAEYKCRSANNSDGLFSNRDDFWDSDDISTFQEEFADILDAVKTVNISVVESPVLCLRQFCDWYVGHSVSERIKSQDIFKRVLKQDGFRIIGDLIFLDKNAIRYAVAALENSRYLRSISNFSRHPFSYFDEIIPLDYFDVEYDILRLISDEEYADFLEENADPKTIISESLSTFYKEIGKFPLLKRDEEIALIERMQSGDLEAKNILIESNLRLVVSIAKRYIGHGVDLEDLIQEGILGLIKALENHQLWHETRISTYATYWIQQRIQRAIEEQSGLVRVPTHIYERLYQIKKSKNKLTQEYGCEPTAEEIAKDIGVSTELVIGAGNISLETVSLDEITEDESSPFQEYLIDRETPSCYERILARECREAIERELQTLTPREEHVIKLRFGLYDGSVRTLEEAGKEFDITRERIRQIEAKALRKLRHPSRARNIKRYLDYEKEYCSTCIGLVPEDYSTSRLYFIDEIVRMHELRGYHMLEKEPLRPETIAHLRRKGYQVLEQLQKITFSNLKNFSPSMAIELVLLLDKYDMRLADGSKKYYPHISAYLSTKLKCRACDCQIFALDWSGLDGYCPACKSRIIRLGTQKELSISIEDFRVFESYPNIEIRLNIDAASNQMKNFEVEKATITTSLGREVDLLWNIEENDDDFNTAGSVKVKLLRYVDFYGDISKIGLRVHNKQSGYHYLYTFDVEKRQLYYSSLYHATLFDYEEEFIMTERQKCEIQKLIRECIAKENGIILPPLVCSGEDGCLGFCRNSKEALIFLENELNQRMARGYKIQLSTLSQIPYEQVITLRDPLPHEQNMKAHEFYQATGTPIDYSEMYIEELDFSTRTFLILKRAGIESVADLISRTEEDMIRVRNMGRIALDEVIQKLTSLGLSLKGEVN